MLLIINILDYTSNMHVTFYAYKDLQAIFSIRRLSVWRRQGVPDNAVAFKKAKAEIYHR